MGDNAGGRVSRIGFLRPRLLASVAISLALAACSNTGAKQASLCTSAGSEAQGSICDGPRTPASLTLPRAELLQRVPQPDPVTTASVNGAPDEAPEKPATAAQEKETPAEGGAAPLSQPPKAASEPESKKSVEDEAKIPPAETPATKASLRSAAKIDLSRIDPIESRARPGQPTVSTFREAVGRAINDHPLIGLASGRVKEALGSIGVAESALYPQLEGRAGIGPGLSSNYQASTSVDNPVGYFSNKSAYGATRGELAVAGKQILFDFGAIKSDVARSTANYDSEVLKLREQTDNISSQVSDVYLRILEQRELYTAAVENLRALEKIVKLVEENEKNGNGTVADMKRVRSRLIDGQTALADAKSELQTGNDKFIRLVKMPPGTLRPSPNLGDLIPRAPEAAIRLVPKGNARIQAQEATLRAAQFEIDTQKATVLPKLGFETDVGVKDYRTNKDRTEVDAKAMLVFKYKFLDGGLQSSQLAQLNARLSQVEMRLRNDLDDMEADIRKQYRILQSARSKSASLQDNLVTSEKARQLYDEQFRGGKRTLLELLDIQTTYYTARRTAINNRYEEQRAINTVLLAIGKLTESALGLR